MAALPKVTPTSVSEDVEMCEPIVKEGMLARFKSMWRDSPCMFATCVIGLVITLGIFIRLMALLAPSPAPHVPKSHHPPPLPWPTSSPPMPTPNAPCMQMGTAALTDFGLSVRSCLQLWPGATGIILPPDNDTAKYGGLALTGMGSFGPPSATFIDQNGVSFSVLGNALPPYVNSNYSVILGQSLSQMIWKATLGSSGVVSLKLNLFVDAAALVLPFRNSSFISDIFNSPPLPVGVGSSYWSRWDFYDTFVPYPSGSSSQAPAAQGTFVNLNQSIYNTTYARDTNATSRQCMRGLLTNQSTVNETLWFSGTLGNGTNLLLFWFPSMHAAFDSELVVVFSNGVTYMSALPPAYRLLAENVNTTRPYTFVIHGTPVGVLQTFTGQWLRHKQGNRPPALC
jgi:hypothetical protein